MAESGLGGIHTTTTVTNSNTTVQTNIRWDPSYIRTVPGILKCAVLILNALIFISITASVYASVGGLSFMSFICGFGIWFTGILLAFYLFHIIEKFYKIPWLKIEMIYCALWTLFLLIGSSISTGNIGHAAIFGVVAFFGFINMIAYGYDAFLKFKGIQSGEIAQGERQVTKSTTATTTPPAY